LTIRPEWQAPYQNHFDFTHVDDAELRDWLLHEKIVSRISSVFETNFRRTSWLIERTHGVQILAKLDRGWIASDGRREALSELELQLLSGTFDNLYEVALELARNQSLPPLLLSKAERGYRLFRNTPRRPVRAFEIDVRKLQTPRAAFRLIAQDCLNHLQSNHAGASDSDDPEYVHQMRVATRRLRAALRMFRPVLPPGLEDTLTEPLRDLMGRLGQARDLDVLVAEIVSPVVRAIPDDPRLTDLAGAITNRQYAVRNAIRHTLKQPAYGRLLLIASRFLHQSPFIDLPAPKDNAFALLPFADRRLRRLLRRINVLAESARVEQPATLHELRIAIKRLRYAALLAAIPDHLETVRRLKLPKLL